MPRLRWPLLLTVLLTASVALAACGGDDDDDDDDDGAATPTTTATATPDAEGGSVAVVLNEWAVEPDVASIAAGEVTFTAENEGSVEHELVIVRSDLAPDALPTAGGLVPETEIDLVAEIEPFSAGTRESLTVRLDAGSYLLICNVAGHYELGMRVAFTVE